MKQIMFDDQKSYDDFGLKLLSYKPDPPTVKENTDDNPGGDGIIDQTDWLGYPVYNNHHPEFTFDLHANDMNDMEDKLTRILNALNGQVKKVYTGDGYYFEGRISVRAEPINNFYEMVVIKINAYPYKLKNDETVVKVTAASSEKTVVIKNEKMPAMPKIKTTGAVTLKLRGVTSTISSSGEYTAPDMLLLEGDNTVTYSGSGTITFTYREGRF